MKKAMLVASIACAALTAGPLPAQVLNFEGIAPSYPFFDPVAINGFYNGGTSSVGTTGPNYGIQFSPNAETVCLNTLSVLCSFASRGGVGDPNSAHFAMAFSEGTGTYINRAAGFINGFSFQYVALDAGVTFWVLDGLNGTGNVLGSLVLDATPLGSCIAYAAPFCPFVSASLTFAGVGRSVTFTGPADQIALDDLAFTAATVPSVVPEPASLALVAAGLLTIAGIAKRRRA